MTVTAQRLGSAHRHEGRVGARAEVVESSDAAYG
jgi:hypothetical protein